jgi:spermidine/putrescine transport system permease protein
MFVSTTSLPFIPAGTLFPLNIRTVLIAHVMFCISYVVVTVKARLQNFPRHLEEAAMDLGANEWTTFWKVTFPLILPGVVAAALLAFSLSIDDYVITALTSGQTETFPLYIYGAQLRGIPVQVNVIGTIIFVSAVGLVIVSTLWQRRQSIRDFTPQRQIES